MAPSGKKAAASTKSASGTKKRGRKPSTTADGKKRKKKSDMTSYGRYIRKVIPKDTCISKQGMAIADSFVKDIFDRIAAEAGRLCAYDKKKTMSSNHILAAAKMILPSDLAQQTIMSGAAAMQNYSTAIQKLQSQNL